MLPEVEAAARTYADRRGALAGLMEALRRSLDDARRAMLPQIRAAAESASAAKADLEREIEDAGPAFVRPRTRTYHGVKVGYQKGRPTVTYGEDAEVIASIRQHHPDQFEQLVKVTANPVLAALAALPESMRKTLGIEVAPGQDTVVIRPADGGMDKAVDALLTDAARLGGGA